MQQNHGTELRSLYRFRKFKHLSSDFLLCGTCDLNVMDFSLKDLMCAILLSFIATSCAIILVGAVS